VNAKRDYTQVATSKLVQSEHPNHVTPALAQEVARRENIANRQRVQLFRVILGIVCVSIVVVIIFVLLLGVKLIHVDTMVAIAFISAMAVQSFVLVGLLVRGLFIHQRSSSDLS